MDAAFFYLFNSQSHPAWLDNLVLFLDLLGRQRTLLILTSGVAAAGFILGKKELWQGALFLTAALMCGAALVFACKIFIHRPRPFFVLKNVYVMADVKGHSFPSGHATLDAVLAAFMIFRRKKKSIFWAFFWAAFAFLGGLGRIYQGVHYPSDVLGGWIFGGVAGWFFARLHRRFQDRGRPGSLQD